MIRYRQGDYAAHVARLAEIDPVEDAVPAPHRELLFSYARWAIDRLGPVRPPLSVLDVGCRLGELGDALPRVLVNYTGCDVNPEAVRRARELGRNVTSGAPLAAFDLVFCRQVLQYAESIPALLASLCVRVAPGGLLCLVQSVPWAIDGAHHWNACDSLEDLTDRIPLPIEHAGPVAAISPSEAVILARRPS